MATILGTSGSDNLAGGAADDSIDGLEGDDTLSGGGGHDLLSGGDGLDILLGGEGKRFDAGDIGRELDDDRAAGDGANRSDDFSKKRGIGTKLDAAVFRIGAGYVQFIARQSWRIFQNPNDFGVVVNFVTEDVGEDRARSVCE